MFDYLLNISLNLPTTSLNCALSPASSETASRIFFKSALSLLFSTSSSCNCNQLINTNQSNKVSIYYPDEISRLLFINRTV